LVIQTSPRFMEFPKGSSQATEHAVPPQLLRKLARGSQSSLEDGEAAYGPRFWFAYAANATMVTANALLTRYVAFLELYEPANVELYLGAIIATGMIGSLLMRLWQGTAMDRHGPGKVWVVSAASLSLACLLHLAVASWVSGPMFLVCVFGLRIVYMTSLAGAFGASMMYISRRAGPHRMAEMVGTLGTSGFVGLILGPLLGDFLFATQPVQPWQVQSMFGIAAALALVSLGFAFCATRGNLPPTLPSRRPPLWGLLRKYYPGSILAVGLALGVGSVFPMMFLANFVRHNGLDGMWLYFMMHSVAAFATRLLIRHFAEQYGLRRMVLIGLSSQILSYLLYLPVHAQWHLLFPAAAAGIAHAFLFPAIVAGGSSTFPARYRGIATSLSLGSIDLGMLIGGPLVGGLLHMAAWLAWPIYETTFVSMMLLLGSFAASYFLNTRSESQEPAPTAAPAR